MCAATSTMTGDAAEEQMIIISSEAGLLFTGESIERAFPPKARASVMPGLRESRKNGVDCDVVFEFPDGTEIWAHRFVLAAMYPGCQILLTTATEALPNDKVPRQDEWIPPVRVIITGISADMLEILIDNAYYKPLQELVGLHNVSRVLDVAEKYNITKIRHHCINVLERNLNPDTCIGTHRLAVRNGYSSLAADAFLYMLRNFPEVWQNSAEFQSLTPEEMRSILTDKRLHAPSEVDDTFRAIVKWISADVDERKNYLAHFLPLVRFAQCTVREWENVVTDPQVQTDEDSMKVLSTIHQTLSRPSMVVGQCAGVDLSAKTWLCAPVPKDIIFIFGGRTGSHSVNRMQAYNCRTRTWRLLDNQSTDPRMYHSMAVLDSCIYVVGGGSGYLTSYNSVICFDLNRKQWSHKASMAFARSNHCVAVL